jgi:hypothetical protein
VPKPAGQQVDRERMRAADDSWAEPMLQLNILQPAAVQPACLCVLRSVLVTIARWLFLMQVSADRLSARFSWQLTVADWSAVGLLCANIVFVLGTRASCNASVAKQACYKMCHTNTHIAGFCCRLHMPRVV